MTRPPPPVVTGAAGQRAVLGSNQPPLGLEPSIPPLMNSRRVGPRDSAGGVGLDGQCVGRDSNPRSPMGRHGYSVLVLPLTPPTRSAI